MEKVTSWIWDNLDSGTRSEDSYWFNNGKIIVVRGNNDPVESTEFIEPADIIRACEQRGNVGLPPHRQITYDFLKAKGF